MDDMRQDRTGAGGMKTVENDGVERKVRIEENESMDDGIRARRTIGTWVMVHNVIMKV